MNLSVNCFHSPGLRFSPRRKVWKAPSTLIKLTELEEFLIGEKMSFGNGMNWRIGS